MQENTVKAINRNLTVRNWLLGFYIFTFEQAREDRAAYGERLLDTLAETLRIQGLSGRNLKLFRQFYLAWPGLATPIHQLLSAEVPIVQTLSAQLPELVGNISPGPAPEVILHKLSFSHLVELLPVEDPLKRTFYEVESSRETGPFGNYADKSIRCTLSGWACRKI